MLSQGTLTEHQPPLLGQSLWPAVGGQTERGGVPVTHALEGPVAAPLLKNHSQTAKGGDFSQKRLLTVGLSVDVP